MNELAHWRRDKTVKQTTPQLSWQISVVRALASVDICIFACFVFYMHSLEQKPAKYCRVESVG